MQHKWIECFSCDLIGSPISLYQALFLLAASGETKWLARPILSENKAAIWELLFKLVLYVLKQLFASVNMGQIKIFVSKDDFQTYVSPSHFLCSFSKSRYTFWKNVYWKYSVPIIALDSRRTFLQSPHQRCASNYKTKDVQFCTDLARNWMNVECHSTLYLDCRASSFTVAAFKWINRTAATRLC